MAEEAWMDEGGAPPKKRGIPGWVWFCGGGCLLAFVAFLVGGVFVFRAIQEGTDPEKQWQRLSEVLPFDRRPEHLEMRLGWDLWLDFFWLEDDRGYTLLIHDLSSAKAAEAQEIFSPEFSGGGPFGIGKPEGAELGSVDVQGRTRSVQRFYQSGDGAEAAPGQPQIQEGQSAFIDITPQGHEGMILLLLVRTRGKDQAIRDEEIRDVLAPFRIGPDYEPPPPAEPAQPPDGEADGDPGEEEEDGR